jgi:D-glycero-alpha-D-manno-heptose 1-phosphate guanylyltransferase
VLEDLAQKGVTRAVLAVGYRRECIMAHFGSSFCGMEIAYSLEDAPLFTGAR